MYFVLSIKPRAILKLFEDNGRPNINSQIDPFPLTQFIPLSSDEKDIIKIKHF